MRSWEGCRLQNKILRAVMNRKMKSWGEIRVALLNKLLIGISNRRISVRLPSANVKNILHLWFFTVFGMSQI